jgi:hypothetical protein
MLFSRFNYMNKKTFITNDGYLLGSRGGKQDGFLPGTCLTCWSILQPLHALMRLI